MPWRFNPFTGNLDETDIPAFNGEVTLGSAASPSIFFTGDPNTGLYSPGADQVAISTNGTGRLFVDATGNVGINEASPSTYSAGAGVPSFVLKGNSDGYADRSGALALVSQDGTTAKTWIYHDTDLFIQSTEATNTRFYTDNTERLRITSAGLVGIGTSNPSSLLHVQTGNFGSVQIERDGTSQYASKIFNPISTIKLESTVSDVIFSSARHFIFQDETGSPFGRWASDGRLGIGTTTPQSPLDVTSVGNVGPTANDGIRVYSANRAQYANIGYFGVNTTSGSFTFNVQDTEAARIDSSGRLLVGTSSGSGNALLQIEGGTIYGDAYLDLCFDGTIASGQTLGELRFTDAASTANVYAKIAAKADGTPGSGDYPGRLVFSTTADGASSPTERMRIDSQGRIFTTLGAFNSAANFVTTTEGLRWIAGTSTTDARSESYAANTATRYHHVFSNPNGAVGSISTNGSATAYNTSSDYRLKENIVPLTGAADRLNQLQVHRFNFIADPETTVDGFIAHEAQAVVPECVTGTKDEVDADGNPLYQGIDQSKLVPLLTAALQEALAEIESLKARLDAANL